MHTRLLLASLACLLSFPAVASAQNTAYVAAPEPPGERRNELDIGYLVGGLDIGTDRRFTRGLQLDVGRRFGDVLLLGEYQYLAVGRDDSASRGALSRVGATVRYSLLRTRVDPRASGKHSPVAGDFWLEGGVGMSRLTWDAGGTLTRPDLALGFGLQLDKVIDRRAERPRLFGPYIAFRAHLARAPQTPAGMPTCGGPCDEATLPSRNNVGLFFHFGANWGR